MIILGDRDIKTLLLDLAQQRAVEDVLSLAVKSLGTARDSALVRIWLVEPDTACPTCMDNAIHLRGRPEYVRDIGGASGDINGTD